VPAQLSCHSSTRRQRRYTMPRSTHVWLLWSVWMASMSSLSRVGSVKNPHPVQERIAKGNGSQCGFCTPGIVMVRILSFLLSLEMLTHLHRVFMPCYETRPNRQNTKSKKDATVISVDAQDTGPSSTPPRPSRSHPPTAVAAAKTTPQLSLPREDAARQMETLQRSHLPQKAAEE